LVGLTKSQQRKSNVFLQLCKMSTAQEKYDRYSIVYDILEYPIEKLVFAKWRRQALSNVQGKLLEVGVGTGKNLQYYPQDVDLTAIDLSSQMLKHAIKQEKKLGERAMLLQMDAQLLKFQDNIFDIVLCTFVLCSVPDPITALKEMKRVCKPGGKIIMIEHVLSANRLIALWQNIHNPLTKALGFNVNRDTKKNILKAGLQISKDEKLGLYDVFRKFECIP